MASTSVDASPADAVGSVDSATHTNGASRHADAVAALFGVLRERLGSQIAAEANADSASALELNAAWHRDDSAARDAQQSPRLQLRRDVRDVVDSSVVLLGSIAAAHPDRVRAPLLDSVDNGWSRASLRRARECMRLRRKRRIQQLRQLQIAVDGVAVDAQTEMQRCALQFEEHTREIHANAVIRLQALLFECVAEMEKAVKRASAVALDNGGNVEAEVHERERSHRWDVFFARLEEDTQGATAFARLHPPHTEASGSDAATAPTEKRRLVDEVARLLASRGPVLGADKVIDVQLVAVNKSAAGDLSPSPGAADDQGVRVKPSLHFADSLDAACATIVSAIASSRGVPARKRRVQSATGVVAYSTRGGACSRIRRINGEEGSQLPLFAVDTRLTCSSVRWLLRCGDGGGSGSLLVPQDACVYFRLSEYQTFLSESNATGATAEFVQAIKAAHDAAAKSDHLENAVDDVGTHVRATINGHETTATEVFGRASLLQLLQTAYFATTFLQLLSSRETAMLEKSYTETIVRADGHLQHLYVALSDTTMAIASPQGDSAASVRMHELDDATTHELCLLYIARGRRDDHNRILSLAQADALNSTLALNMQLTPTDDARRQYCVVQNPRLLLGNHLPTSLRSTASLLVEFRIQRRTSPDSEIMKQVAGSDPVNAKHLVRALLERTCSWRSCLDEPLDGLATRGSPVCSWHKVIQQSMGPDEWTQYAPNIREMKACAKAMTSSGLVNVVNKVLLKSSSLLEELTSRQLINSIDAFFRHTRKSLSNSAFEDRGKVESAREDSPGQGVANHSLAAAAASERLETLSVLRDVAAIEKQITFALRESTSSGIRMTDLWSQLQEFNSGIRTDNAELLLELSRRKLAIVRARVEQAVN